MVIFRNNIFCEFQRGRDTANYFDPLGAGIMELRC